jgi:hypothetical protein
MSLRDDIIALPKSQRAAYKADLMQKAAAALLKQGSYTFTHQGYTVTISEPLLITNGFQLHIEAIYGGKQLTLSNPFRFINPPIAVSPTANADLALAMKTMIVGTLKVVT